MSSRDSQTSTATSPDTSPLAVPRDVSDVLSTSSMSPIPSPGASTFLRTAATLEGLSRQLGDLKDDSTGDDERCCCGATGGCPTWKEREKVEDKLKLAGEIGDALLQRYEALERRHRHEMEKYEKQLEVKRTALAESLRRVNNLEKANTTHLAHYAEMSKRNEALEKRYTQSLHTQTLTQQSLTHVRAELTNLRAKASRHVSRVSNAEMENKMMDLEKRYEEMRDNYELEVRNARDEARRRKRAEARVEEIQGQLDARRKEVEEVKESRAKDAQELLANAKDRLAILHDELSETFRAESPADAPEYQKTLEDLVASNALLKHDASELSHLLTESREEVRTLKQELEEVRSTGIPTEDFPSSKRLASELMRSHNRTESSPNVGNTDRASWARMSVHIPSSRTWERDREHARKASLAPSFTSSSSYAGNDGNLSPGLGMGPIGEYGGVLVNEASVSGASSDGRESPIPILRSSPNGGIGYVLNGVPKSKTTLPRPPVRRSISENRPRPIRTYSPNQPDAIAEWGSIDRNVGAPLPDEPLSPAGSEYFRTDASRKRRSILLSRASTREEGEYSPTVAEPGDVLSPTSEGGMSPHDAKRVHRRTLLLLTKSTGVQTDPVAEYAIRIEPRSDIRDEDSLNTSTATSPQPNPDGSETSSLHDNRQAAGVLTILVDHLTKIMTRLRGADIASLNRRLKKQHLPGDVSHLSRSTLRNLQNDIADLRNLLKGSLDVPVSRREIALLLKLLKDVFGELIELQAVVNDVTIDPSLAKKLQKEAYRDEDAEEAKNKAGAGGLGWIAAPLTKFFVTPAQEEDASRDRPAGMRDKGKLQPATVRAPKLQASTSATTTHVSVEFGGAGIVRRATPARQAAAVADALPSPDPSGEATFAQPVIPPGKQSLAPPRPSTLRQQKSKANRNELLGIFAGTTSRAISPTPWTVVPQVSPIPPRQLRATSSQYFGDKTVKGVQTDTASKKKLSAAVDAVIDRTAHQIDESDPTTVGSFEPPLLERTLRPRGLSDSSIRSTFINHDPSSLSGGPGAIEQAGYGESGQSRGYLGNLASRWYPFKAAQPNLPTSTQDTSAESTLVAPTIVDGEGNDVLPKEIPSPSRPIPTRKPVSDEAGGISPKGSVPLGQSQSLLGMLAGSMNAVAEVEDGEENELREGRLRRGPSRVGGGTSWR